MKEIQKKCGNCLAYNHKEKHCMVVILHNGEKINLPTEPEDDCFFEQEFQSKNEENEKTEKFKVEIKQVRIWTEDPKTGEPTSGNGIVKIETPEEFWKKS